MPHNVNTAKIPVCFLCLGNVESKKKITNGNRNGDDGEVKVNDLLILRRFLSHSLELPQAVIGDLLCSRSGHDHDKSLLCDRCNGEIGAACEIYRELAEKLKKLEGILEDSTKKVSSGKLSSNLHQKLASQMNHSLGEKVGGQRVKRLRNLLASKLAKDRTKLDEHEDAEVTDGDEVAASGSGGNGNGEIIDDTDDKDDGGEGDGQDIDITFNESEIEKGETETSENGTLLRENENAHVSMELDDCNLSWSMTKPEPDVPNNDNDDSDVVQDCDEDDAVEDEDNDVMKRPFQCLRCNDLFENIEAVEEHVGQCPYKYEQQQQKDETKTKTKPRSSKLMKSRGGGGVSRKISVKSKSERPKGTVRLCRFCGKELHRNYDLILHERTHTGEKPFKCPKCGRLFNNKSNCTKHQVKGICSAKVKKTRVKIDKK